MRFRVFTEIMFYQERLGYLRLAREAKYLLLAPAHEHAACRKDADGSLLDLGRDASSSCASSSRSNTCGATSTRFGEALLVSVKIRRGDLAYGQVTLLA